MKKFKKILFTLFITIILSAIFKTHYAYSTLTNFAPKYGKLSENVNFRSIPSTTSGKIRILSKGTSIKMVGTLDNFYIVQLGTNEVGVVYKSYITSISSAPVGASTYTMITKKAATVAGDSVNYRRGPGTNFTTIAKLSKGIKVTIIGYISDWYLCITSSGTVGMIKKSLVTTSTTSSNTGTSTGTTTTTTVVKGDTNEELVLKLINQARASAGLKALTMDANILKIARLKATDMVNKGYFSHSSPTYGSPFAMMKTYGISYKVAGENIAGNPSIEAAVNSWLNSSTHRENILSNSYNLIGIGVTKSDVYGYIIVAMFVGR